MNIEYAVIKDADGNEVFRDPDFKDDLAPMDKTL